MAAFLVAEHVFQRYRECFNVGKSWLTKNFERSRKVASVGGACDFSARFQFWAYLYSLADANFSPSDFGVFFQSIDKISKRPGSLMIFFA